MHEIARGEVTAPAKVIDLDLDAEYGAQIIDVTRFATAWCLLRRSGVPVETRFLDLENCSELALSELQGLFTSASAGPLVTTAEAEEVVALTIVICTRDRPAGLARVIESLSKQTDLEFEVLVVDNSATGEIANASRPVPGLNVRYRHEPRAGLSRARNRGLAAVRTELHAWIDDDEVADPGWVAWIKRGFTAPCRPDAVTGVMLPAELETAAQVMFERYGGFNKGRGMCPQELRAGTPTVLDPIYPLPNFGAGGNMAFRTEKLRAIGGFDNRLGAGTLTHGGEETLALSLLLQAGSTVLYWPPAVTWHFHRVKDAELERQFFGYSAGLTAFYMSLICRSPAYLWKIALFVPRGIRQILANRQAGGLDGPPDGFPVNLIRAGRRGLYRGAGYYLREWVRQRKICASRHPLSR